VPAVVLRFIIIGEATNQIPPSLTARYPEIEWRRIAGPLGNAVEAMIGEEGGR